MTDKKVREAWREEWKNNSTIEESASPIGRWLRRQRLDITRDLLEIVIVEDGLDLSVIDLGCGGGTTLRLIRDMGLYNSIGIDYEPNALRHCEKVGFKIDEDVYLGDAVKTVYKNKQFFLVFSEGLWEHFEDPVPYITEACRIADKWLLIIQPDHFSFFGRLLHWAWIILGGGGVKEHSFKMSYFIDKVNINGFKLYRRDSTLLNEQAVLLFRRLKE